MQTKSRSRRTIMRSEKFWLPLGLLGMLMISNVFPQQHSTLWGVNGEKWDPEILPDFSKAGYQEGMKPIPQYPVSVNVKDYGAVGDGKTDNTMAFRKAIVAAKAFTSVYIPDGVYVIKDTIHIGKSISLRGQSRDQTVLYFPNELEDLYPDPYVGRIHKGVQVSWYAYRGAFLILPGGEEKGVETLTLKFPNVKWRTHHLERGYNGIWLSGEKNGWVKNVRIINTDYGIYISGSNNLTITDILFEGESNRTGISGHHGVAVYHESFYCLVENVDFGTAFVHELSLGGGAVHHNVFSNCQGKNIHMDHHFNKGQKPFSTNLWTNMDLGSGKGAWGNNAQGNEPENKATAFKGLTGSTFGDVYWNIRSTEPINAPLGMSNITVGMNTNDKASFKWDAATYKHIHEKIDPAKLEPKNLYEAQLAYKKKNTVAITPIRHFRSPERPAISRMRNSIQVTLPSNTDKLTIHNLQGKMLYELIRSRSYAK